MLSSCSCYYKEVTHADSMPKELPLGTKVKSVSKLYVSLEESIDNPKILHIYISSIQIAKKRYVKQRFIIPTGTIFSVYGYTKPRNPLCFNQGLNVLLLPEKPLVNTDAKFYVKVDQVFDSSMFSIHSQK